VWICFTVVELISVGTGRDNEDDNCNAAGAHRRAAKENISLVFHGNTITHMDCFSHFFFKGKMYNNR
jgi:hypothetical protein